MSAAPADWSDAERAAWAPPERLSVSDWCDRYRIISARKGNPEPGAWRTARTPYLREPMDALGDPAIREMWWMKAAQVGGSEGARNGVADWIDQKPGPLLIVYPTRNAAEEQLAERVRPMIEDTPRLAAHLPGGRSDFTGDSIDLDTMPIWVGWAGSPQALASRPCMYVILDEEDKFPPFSGRESSPSALAKARTRTFEGRELVLHISTPTTAAGPIAQGFDACQDRRRYFVPCPACSDLMPIVFGQVRWESERGAADATTADRIESGAARVWYECPFCRHELDEGAFQRVKDRGEWVSDGFPPGEHPASARRAYHIHGLAATIGVKLKNFAAKFLRVRGDVAKLMEFTNQDLGEPFQNQLTKIEAGSLKAKAARGHKAKLVPKWAAALIVTADTQRAHFVFTVRAWGRGERSRLIDAGTAKGTADLDRLKVARYPIDGWKDDPGLAPALLLVDVGGGTKGELDGNRTDEVYRWARTDPTRIFPVKGYGSKGGGRPAQEITPTRHTYTPKGASTKLDVQLFLLDTQQFKDILAARIDEERTAPEVWELCAGLPDDYFRQMANEHKVAVRSGMAVVERWEKKSAGAPVDYFDCEVYQIAGSKLARVDTAPDEATLERQRFERAKPKKGREGGDDRPWVDGSGWWAR